MKTKLVCGQGIYEKGTFKVTIDGRMTKEYQAWSSMLHRCDPAWQSKSLAHASYEGCTIHPDFIKYQDFAAWCRNQIGLGHDLWGWQLDKDILVPGNKVYGPDTCCFVPRAINAMLTHKQSNKGLYPVGVCLYRPTEGYNPSKPYKAAIGAKHIGYYATPEEAHEAYKVAKLADIYRHAENWKHLLDPRVYAALKAYKI